MYERFWKRELDLEDAAVIERVLEGAGARTAGFREYARGEGRVLHDGIQHRAFDAGIFGVPTYVIDGEVFFGREHLLRIRWMLTGRDGPPPGIANPDHPTERASVGEFTKGQLPVAIDFKSPNAYLAIAPTCAMADELGIVIDWQPLVLPAAKASAAPTSEDDRGARHRRIRANYLERDVARYAADRGLTLNTLNQRKDSTLAGIGLLWVKRQSPSLARQYVERVFDRHWQGKLDIEDGGSIRGLLAEIAAPVAGFESFAQGEGRAELARVQSELRDKGVFEVPAYLASDDIFIGRQHLPLIRSQLSAAGARPPSRS